MELSMNGNGQYRHDLNTISGEEHISEQQVSIGQLRRLVQLLDESDVSEIEVKRASEGMHLVLRKAMVQAESASGEYPVLASANSASVAENGAAPLPVETRHTITSGLVGIFHTWAKPKGKALISVGDHVKTGQVVGTIQSLNVISEVETTIAGRVVEILVQEGQPIEYGQRMMVIDSSEEA
jgi:acetyl-CoA carboxylase biotin carboxyl carrier protein